MAAVVSLVHWCTKERVSRPRCYMGSTQGNVGRPRGLSSPTTYFTGIARCTHGTRLSPVIPRHCTARKQSCCAGYRGGDEAAPSCRYVPAPLRAGHESCSEGGRGNNGHIPHPWHAFPFIAGVLCTTCSIGGQWLVAVNGEFLGAIGIGCIFATICVHVWGPHWDRKSCCLPPCICPLE